MNLITKSRATLLIPTAVALVLTAPNVNAGAFQTHENSTPGIATAHANKAEAADAAAGFDNPAAFAKIGEKQFVMTATPIFVSAKFNNNGSRSLLGEPLAGGNGGNGGGGSLVPGLAMAIPFGSNVTAGLTITAPFAIATEWESNWIGRYSAIKTDLKTFDINPAIAFKVANGISIGAGFSAQRAEAELSKAIDFGSLCVAQLAQQFGLAGAQSTCLSGFISPQTRDGTVTLSGKSWDYGFNAGVLFDVGPATRLGLSYRSKVKHELEGGAKYNKPAFGGPLAAITESPLTTDSNATAALNLPETLSFAAFHQVNPQLALMADISHTRWSAFKEIRVKFASGVPDNVEPEQYKDVTRVSFGATYQMNDSWQVRGGLAFDPTPVRNNLRDPRVPDGDRTWLAFGANYTMSKETTFSMGYAHLFVKNPTSAQSASGTLLQGSYKVNGNLLSLQIATKF